MSFLVQLDESISIVLIFCSFVFGSVRSRDTRVDEIVKSAGLDYEESLFIFREGVWTSSKGNWEPHRILLKEVM